MTSVDFEDDYEDFDDDTDEPEEAPKKSGAPKALRQQNSKLAKENKELLERLQALEAKERKGNLALLLEKAGAKPALARFVDIEGDIDEKSVESWLEENGELFGYEKPGEEADDVDDDTAEQAGAINRASAAAPPPGSPGLTPEKLRNMTYQELLDKGILDPK